MSDKTPVVAIVDLYDDCGNFQNRVDFTGNGALAEARNYANSIGEIVTSGTCAVLDDLSAGVLDHFSTFLPDGADICPNRFDAADVKRRKTLKVFVVRKPRVPMRSQLHAKALTMDELTFGLNVQRYHRHTPMGEIGIVVGEPYLCKPHCGRDIWMVKVATKNYAGKPDLQDWYLADIGVVPYGGSNVNRRWNDSNYTLAVNA